MKYFIITIFVFSLCLLYSSFITPIRFIFPYFNLLFVIIFSYYISRQSILSIYVVFIAGIFYDVLSISQVGVTSANYLITLIVFTVLSNLVFPSERLGRAISIIMSSLAYSLISFTTINFISSNNIDGIILTIPWALINAIMIIILSNIIVSIFPVKKDNKIRIG